MHDIDHIKIKYPQLLTVWQLFVFVIQGKGSNFVHTVATNLTNHSPLLQKKLCHLKGEKNLSLIKENVLGDPKGVGMFSGVTECMIH